MRSGVGHEKGRLNVFKHRPQQKCRKYCAERSSCFYRYLFYLVDTGTEGKIYNMWIDSSVEHSNSSEDGIWRKSDLKNLALLLRPGKDRSNIVETARHLEHSVYHIHKFWIRQNQKCIFSTNVNFSVLVFFKPGVWRSHCTELWQLCVLNVKSEECCICGVFWKAGVRIL